MGLRFRPHHENGKFDDAGDVCIHAVDSAHSSDALVASGGSVRSPLRAGRNSQGAQRVASPSAGDPQVPRGGLALTALHASG